MGNMGYCKFENTVKDLKECYDHIQDDLSDSEAIARIRLLKICRDIINEWDDEMEE